MEENNSFNNPGNPENNINLNQTGSAAGNTGSSGNNGNAGNTGYTAGPGYASGQGNTAGPGSAYTGPYTYANYVPEPPKKKKHTFLKIIGILFAAILFGAIAGMSMLAVSKLTGVLDSVAGITDKIESTVRLPGSGAEEETAVPETVPETKPAIVTPTVEVRDYGASADDVSAIVEAAMPAVVAITGTSEYQYWSWFGPSQTYEAESSGSGIIVGENEGEYLVVTNNHVVEGTKALAVKFIDDEVVEATIKGTDSDADVAIIVVKKEDVKESTAKAIRIAPLGDSDSIKVGQRVIAIGNALGFGQSVTVGYVSAKDRTLQNDQDKDRKLIQTDAAINPGNSGGALINMSGQVIGINEAKYSSTEVEGMGYAIPITQAKSVIEQLSSFETRDKVEAEEQGYLGIQGQSIDKSIAETYHMPQGAYVHKVLEGSAAQKGGLKEGDIITKVDGHNIGSMEELADLLTHYKAGEKVEVQFERHINEDYKEMTLEIELGKKEELDTEE